ncbi:fumarylacetoacetate hydrolase family protein [Arthrobacter globiformis]|uniref:Fumarylacetoacetate hydrolase n=1 Tax=Arthrobacter globiformis TaxID=1665 RepID=A0A328HI88_ARTGO|nr:fumarylacetoacetate hydrolase family protein [Arthrobacter globiformis]RAM38336.1 fumarylacetoacetate hydrolase [Arthrobacter globiformis]
MLIGTVDNRAHLIQASDAQIRGLDIAEASQGRFSSSVSELFTDWEALRGWAEFADFEQGGARTISADELQAPVSSPRQVFAIGMNYKDHAAEVNLSLPTTPAVFTKYVSSLIGAADTVELPSTSVDWEVELVAVIGTGGRDIPEESALEHVAGYMVGQDLSDRELQFAGGGAPQFSIAKSYKGFAPTGPWITSSDEVADSGNLSMTCSRGDEVLQQGTTRNLVFNLPYLIHHLSSIVELYPGDLIFTGTPDGVGFGRSPQQYLVPGDELVSSIEGLGEIRQRFVARGESDEVAGILETVGGRA